jgi:hypothetical protein
MQAPNSEKPDELRRPILVLALTILPAPPPAAAAPPQVMTQAANSQLASSDGFVDIVAAPCSHTSSAAARIDSTPRARSPGTMRLSTSAEPPVGKFGGALALMIAR